MPEKTKLLWHSNAPWTSTGYGAQTALFTERLKDQYDISISAFYGLEGNVLPWKDIAVLPGMGGNTYGDETIRPHASATFGGDLRGGIVLTLMDVWVLNPAIWSNFNLASWVPVDHNPAPGPVVEHFTQTGAVPIAMAKFGQRMLKDAGLDPLYVPHAVDTSVYVPKDKVEARKAVGLDDSDADTFIVGMVAANKGNPSRKCFAEAFEAFAAFHARHKDSKLFVYTEPTGIVGGVNLPQLVNSLKLDPDSVVFPDPYRTLHFPHKPEQMANYFNSFDVLLAPSAGEGFGIPVVEAQACGVPVIVSDFSAQPELVGAGWMVEGERAYTAIGSWQFKPSVEDIHSALTKCYGLSDREKKDRSTQAENFAQQYDVETVMADHMLPALAEVEKRYAEREPKLLKAA